MTSPSSSLKGRLQKPSLASRPIPLKGSTESEGGVPTVPRLLSGLNTDLLSDFVSGPVMGPSGFAGGSGVELAAGVRVCCVSKGVSFLTSSWTETKGPSPRRPSTAACKPLQPCKVWLQDTGKLVQSMYAVPSNDHTHTHTHTHTQAVSLAATVWHPAGKIDKQDKSLT